MGSKAVSKELIMSHLGRQEFALFVKKVCKDFRHSKLINYDGHDRGQRLLRLRFKDEELANQVISEIKSTIAQHGFTVN